MNHWYRNCPDRDTNGGETVDVVESVHIVEAGCNKSAIVHNNRSDVDTSTKNRGILDTACTSSVCGDPWISRFIASLPETARKRVKKIDTQTKFVFGDGKSSWSKYKIRLPVEICTVRCFIVVDVIDGNLPLLFSKSAMKRMKAVIDTINDAVPVFDQKTPNEMLITKSGHYALDLTFTGRGKWSEQTECEESVLAVESTELTEMDLEKLHVQFAHCSTEKLLTLLKNAGYECGSLAQRLQEMCKKCKICIGNSRNRPRPKVGLPLAHKFNDVVAMDLHQLSFKEKLWFLHIIDEFSRLSDAVINNSKSSENIISSLVKYWILRFGPPRGIHVDNGREFKNGELRNLCQRHGIRIFPTTPYSPWSNGLCERHNGVISEMLDKTMTQNPNMALDLALKHVIFAKNCLESHLGFTPYQLVFGHNPRLPSVLNDDIPALETTSISSLVADHFKLLEASRSGFIRADCSERVRRALLGKVRYSDAPFMPGESVFYKRQQSGPWQGPGRVILHEGQELIIKDGGQIITVHAFRASRINGDNAEKAESESEVTVNSGKLVSNDKLVSNESETWNIPPSYTDHDQHSAPLVSNASGGVTSESCDTGVTLNSSCSNEVTDAICDDISENGKSRPGSVKPKKGGIV